MVPAHTLRLVRQWVRRLRRCYRAARRGQVELARRLRPADLWLEHSEHSVPETAAWDWDMRPLVRGEPAVPLPVSGRGGVRPATSIALCEVARGAAGFADQAIVSEMLQGVQDDSTCRRGTLLCGPHAGGLALLSVALGKTEANVEQGWCSGGHSQLPCWPMRTCPFSVVDESERAGQPKFRLTIDLSWPHPGMVHGGEGFVDSVNDGMDRSVWPPNRLVRVSEYTEAVAILQGRRESCAVDGGEASSPAVAVGSSTAAAVSAAASAGGESRRVRAWGLDGRAFYRAVGRQRRELWRNAIMLPDGAQLDERCCFGDAAAATKCARISNFLVFHMRRELARIDSLYPTRDPAWLTWLAARRAAAQAAGLPEEQFAVLHWVAMYIDDSMGASADDLLYDSAGSPVLDSCGVHMRRAQAHFEAARAVLERFGWRSAPGKEQPPGERVESLGVEVDLQAGRMRLSEAKRVRYAGQAEQVSMQHVCARAEFEQLLGRLQFAVQCFPIGKQHVRAAWRVMRAHFRLAGGAVRVTAAVRRDLLWWVAELRSPAHAGVPLAQTMLPRVGGGTAAIYADAAGSAGFMAWGVHDGELLFVEGAWSAAERATLTIAELELLASTFGLVALSPLMGPHVLSFTDNVVAQAAMRRMTAGSPRMQQLVARRTVWLYERGVVEGVARITSDNNLWADPGSRGRLAEALQQAEALGLRPRRVELPAEWRDTDAMLAVEE